MQNGYIERLNRKFCFLGLVRPIDAHFVLLVFSGFRQCSYLVICDRIKSEMVF